MNSPEPALLAAVIGARSAFLVTVITLHTSQIKMTFTRESFIRSLTLMQEAIEVIAFGGSTKKPHDPYAFVEMLPMAQDSHDSEVKTEPKAEFKMLCPIDLKGVPEAYRRPTPPAPTS